MSATKRSGTSFFGRVCRISVCLGLMLGAVQTACAVTGDSRATAVAISVGSSEKTKSITLVDERGSDGETTGWGVYYFKVSLSQGSEYTFWSSGVMESSVSAYLGKYDSEFGSVNNDFSSDMASDGLNFWLPVYADSWSDELTGGTFYLVLNGDVGQSVTLHWKTGIETEPIPAGIDEEHAVTLSVGTAQGQASGMLIDGNFYYKANLTAGSKYKFETKGGSLINGDLSLSVYPANDAYPTPDPVPIEPGVEHNDGIIILPEATTSYFIVVSGEDSATFTLVHQVVPARLPGKHPAELLVPTLQGTSVEFEPNARNNPSSGFYDAVIDEQLFAVPVTKDVRYVFETEGDVAPDGLVMEVYDAAGNVLFRNRKKMNGSTDTMIAYKAAATGTNWVGVCQDLDEPTNYVYSTLTAWRLAADATGQADEWDAGDDVYTGASGLAPLPGALADSAVASGVPHGPHTLGLTDFKDWFRIDARLGISYKLQAQTEPGFEELTLAAKVYTLSGTTLTLVQEIADLNAGGVVNATKHGSYYIDVSVKDGQGLDYGPYTLYSLAYNPAGTALGLLRVDIGGPTAADGGLWWMPADGTTAPKYPGGATVLLPAGAKTVQFNPVTGWTTPANQTATVAAGAVPTVISVKYNDTSDPKDNAAAGATALTLTNVEQKRSHSLWAEDAADWFKLAVKSDSYYTFRLSPYAGQPMLTVFRSNQTDVVATGTELTFLARENGTYYVKVGHADPANPADSSYTLNYKLQTVGYVKFEKTAYTFKEGVPTADVKVTRSAKDGRVRVRYTTVAGTALPGVNYKPVSGYLEWANGNNLTQTIAVPLIPNLYAAWEEDKVFSVEIEPVPANEIEEDEWIPPVPVPVTTVTVTEITKKAPGKLGFAGYGDDADQVVPFDAPLKPALAVPAGEWVTLWVSRTAGGDGVVAAKAETVKGTALPDVNFEQNTETLVWAAGDLSPKPFTVRTMTTGEVFQITKQLTVKLTVDTTLGGAATLGASTATVSVRDPQVDRFVEQWAAAGAAPAGVTVKPVKNENWFFGWDGVLRSIPLMTSGAKAELSVAVTGPGTLRFAPELLTGGGADNSTFTYTVGTKTLPCKDGAEVVLYLAKGPQTVKFAVSRGSAAPAGSEVFGRFCDLEGQPFQWSPLPAASAVNPLDKAVVAAEIADDMTFEWAAEGVPVYRLLIADTTANLTKAPMVDQIVEGANSYCPGCAVFAGFTPGKTYYWRVDSILPGADVNDRSQDRLVNTNAVWSLIVSQLGVPQTAGLVTDALAGFVGQSGALELVQGVAYNIGPFSSPNRETFKATNLPVGMALKTVNGLTYLAGVPTKTNGVVAILQASRLAGTVTQTGTTLSIPVTVAPLALAAGTFNGLLQSADVSTNAHESLASVSFTATEAGNLTAKVLVAGKTYAFAGTGFSGAIDYLENGQPGVRAELFLKSMVANVTYTNALTLTVCRGSADDVDALNAVAGAVLDLKVPAANNLSVRPMAYEGMLVRDGSKIAAVTNGLKPFVGYYTVALPSKYAVGDGEPEGASYVTLTLDAKGTAKLSGVLADATAWSASGVPGYVSEYGERGAPAVLVPVYTAKAQMAAGGWVVLSMDETTGLPVATGEVQWFNADPKSTRDGVLGFGLTLEAAGGYYDTLFSLQTYYLNHTLTIGEMMAPSQLDETTYAELVAWPASTELTLSVTGDTMAAAKRALVKSEDNPAFYDFDNSVNPCNLSFTIARATGLFNGSFSLWYLNGTGTQQKEKTGLKFQGVLTPVKHSSSAYLMTPGLGFYQIPETLPLAVGTGTRAWTGSYLFSVNAEEFIPDWTEGWAD